MTYTVAARRWKHGWELHIDGIGVTQSKTLATAASMVRDYIESLTDQDVTTAEIVIVPELDELGERVANVKEQVAAAEAQRQAAVKAFAKVTEDLRRAGLSAADCAFVLGKSRGRIAQIAKAS
jgi:hypothetical protein